MDEIEAEISSPMGRADRVEAACRRLEELRGEWSSPGVSGRLERLALLLTRRAGPVVEPAAALLEEVAARARDPWSVLSSLVASPNAGVSERALERAVRLAAAGVLRVDPGLVANLAEQVDRPGAALATPRLLSLVAELVTALPAGPGERPGGAPELFMGSPDPGIRRLAARLLDARGEPPPAELTRRVLGEEGARLLLPYLEFTRATHLDLLGLTPEPGTPPPALDAFRRAEASCGEALLRGVVGELGWGRVNCGLEIVPRVGVSSGGSFPLLLHPVEAALVEGEPGIRRVFERWLVVAHGGSLGASEAAGSGEDPVNRFRTLNLLHADALGDLLDVAPLSTEKVRRIVGRLDRIVEAFCGLFGPREPDECAVVADVYRDLRERVERELEGLAAGGALSMELTRLVQMFEDPRNAGEVRTLHGLKRYLHQKGLKLGFRLAETGRGTNRTVDLAVVVPRPEPRVERVVRAIEYVDFEEGAPAGGPGGGGGLPWPVRVVVDGLGRQLLHGQESVPKVKAFCYGNEAHYYLAFRNHPVFLRVDYAPPLRGGMLDLEYYGVSKYQLDSHPNPSLEAIGCFFRRLDIEAQIEATRIHARYDKERAVDLGDLCEKVASVFRLAPYLMDVDWLIGDLALEAGARAAVAEGWADFFARWGVLPVSQLLTADRVGILAGIEPEAGGAREVRWDGRGSYRDRFTASDGAGVAAALRSALGRCGIRDLPSAGPGARSDQLSVEKELLEPLRAMAARGEIVATPDGYVPAPADLFERVPEARWFARLLEGDAAGIARATRIARLAAALERHVRFQTTGSLNGHEVQSASLPLRGEAITLYGLRDAAGNLRLAAFTLDGALARSRESPSAPWRENGILDAEALAGRLLRDNVPVTWSEAVPGEPDAEALRALFRAANPRAAPPPLPGERVVRGIAAAPGRATGLACLGLEGRAPADVAGTILVASTVRPEDSPLIFAAAGVLSTGGSVLSHAGLLAMQFGKPALVVGGTWEGAPGGAPSVLCRRVEFDESSDEVGPWRVVERRARGEREDRIREGDLLVLDADAGLLRVLGQGRDAQTVHAGLEQLSSATRRLAETEDEAQLLVVRGERLHARHQLERLFSRLEDPVLARHAVRELLEGEVAELGSDPAELLGRLLGSPAVGGASRAAVLQIAGDLSARTAAASESAGARIPDSTDPQEILTLRRDVLRLRRNLETVTSSLERCGIPSSPGRSAAGEAGLDGASAARLSELRDRLAREVAEREGRGEGEREIHRLRHVLQLLRRLDELLGIGGGLREAPERLLRRLSEEDAAAREALAGRFVLGPADGGVELRSLVGGKAAALAEAARLGEGAAIPGWFVVSDGAFREALEVRSKGAEELAGLRGSGASLGTVIARIVERRDWSFGLRSALVRRAWEATPLPDGVAAAVADAYRALDPGSEPFVAIRSSAREEDTESATRAGEFDTFLFVRGVPAVLDHLRLAWAGLWTERALHGREALGGPPVAVGGGVLVQRMVDARVAGVLHTVNMTSGRPREILVNAGLGLGEGVVSGTVVADEVTVEKADGELRFRYVTRDKRERVVFNARAGTGTVRVETLYHQRLRPALEYAELCELVRRAVRLESLLLQPLDIEFAIEGARLWLLQLRPIPAALAVWRETAERYPIPRGGAP